MPPTDKSFEFPTKNMLTKSCNTREKNRLINSQITLGTIALYAFAIDVSPPLLHKKDSDIF